MKKLVIVKVSILLAIVIALASCSRYVSVNDAANGKARCGKWLK